MKRNLIQINIDGNDSIDYFILLLFILGGQQSFKRIDKVGEWMSNLEKYILPISIRFYLKEVPSISVHL